MFAGIDDHEIFDAPHGQDNDLTEEEEEGLVTEVITDVELSHLDSHQRSIMISEIMEKICLFTITSTGCFSRF